MSLFLFCLVGIFTLLFLRNVLNWAFSMENYFTHKKRMSQLKFEEKKDTNYEDLINSIGKPVRKYILPLNIKFDKENIEKKLIFTEWNKYFNAESFVSFDITLKILAIILIFIMYKLDTLVMGIIWGGVMFFALNFLLDNKVSAKREKVYDGFPDFLRITQGFLSSGMIFLNAIEKTLPYMNEEWQELLKNLITDFKTYNIETALNNLKETTDIFEIKEFVALVKLVLEQGGDIKQGFESQAESIIEMQQFLLEKKIAKRKTLSIVVQAPIMLCIFAAFGLPIVGDMTSIGLI